MLAVVVAGLYLGYKAPQSGYATRLQEQAVWRASDTILESVVFALIGLQLTSVVAAAGDIRSLLVTGVIVTLAAVVARIVWVFPATYIPGWIIPSIGRRDPAPSWQVPAVISWSGMRGVVTLAAAFAIPATVPGRETIVFLAFFVTVATLLLHGLTLPTVIRKLGVHEDGFQRRRAGRGADAVRRRAGLDLPARRADGRGRLLPRATRPRSCGGWRSTAPTRCGSSWAGPESEAGESPSAAYRRLRREMLDSERTTFVARRDSGDIDDEVLRRVLRRLDFEEAALARDER